MLRIILKKRARWDLTPKGVGTSILKSPTPEKKLEKQSTASISTPEVSRAGFEPKPDCVKTPSDFRKMLSLCSNY
jgi:hypothetical protein